MQAVMRTAPSTSVRSNTSKKATRQDLRREVLVEQEDKEEALVVAQEEVRRALGNSRAMLRDQGKPERRIS